MSQKNLRKRRQGAAKAMPVQTIRTRFKSSVSQQKTSQNQNQNETTPAKYASKTYTRSPKKSPKSENTKQTQEATDTEGNKEFYPDKLKRLLKKKEIVLKPKPTYKLIGGLGSMNKRKLGIPKKETTYVEDRNEFPAQYCEDSNDTFENNIDLICLDDSDSLDEEDLLEILTCESPVWWEDPPDEGYDEEPLSITMNDKNYDIRIIEKNMKINAEDNAQGKNQEIKNIALHRNNNLKEDKNFVVRRNKLESLLGNIKQKKNNDKTLEKSNKGSSLPNKSSECLDEEVLDEDILKTLENIDIPIEDSKQEPTVKAKESIHTSKGKESSTESAGVMTKLPKALNIKPVKGLTIKKCDIKQFQPKLEIPSPNKVRSTEEIEKNKMFLKTWSEQCDLKVLRSNKKTNESESTPGQPENKVSGLTINDQNPNGMVKQIKTRNRKRKSDNNESNEIPKKKTQKKNNLRSGPSDNDQITVYKIIEQVEENKDTKSESRIYNTKLNSYYNQCKNINKTKKEIDGKLVCESEKTSVCNNSQTVKSIPVSNNETVKYCLQCSSIFDNDTCNYCAIKSNSDAKQYTNKVKADAS